MANGERLTENISRPSGKESTKYLKYKDHLEDGKQQHKENMQRSHGPVLHEK